MFKKVAITVFILTAAIKVSAQSGVTQSPPFPDSTVISIHPVYDSVSGVHRWLFGKNYRTEWATAVKLPVIKISQFKGGLKPLREGGGYQSKSLRLVDASGKEWVIRSVEKTPDKLLPPTLRGTFAIDWLDDALSSQHPLSALVVPPLAKAAGIPHTDPIIGVVAPDPALGEYSKIFDGLVVLLEEREPAGKSDNSVKMLNELNNDNDNRVNGEQFLRARMLDLLLGDWDRHEDQWRWAYDKKNKEKTYYAVPRDRDQVFHLSQGVFPWLAARTWVTPTLDDFEGKIPRVEYSLFKTRFIQPYPDAQISRIRWMQIANDFVKAETDDVLESGLKRLPPEMYRLRHKELLTKLKQRRDAIPVAMDEYYRFINRTVDLRTSNKNEQVTITGMPNKALRVQVSKLDKDGAAKKDQIMDMTYDPAITKELRLYVQDGDDRVIVNNSTSPVKLRVIGERGQKIYEIKNLANPLHLYSRKDSVSIAGNTGRVNSYLSNDTLNTRFIQNNPYNIWMPLVTAAINADDGVLLGAGFKYTRRDGFRKLPYASVQQLMVSHAFATDAFRVRYSGEWIDVVGKADLLLSAFVQAPNNTLNYFGRGNNTPLIKFDGYRRFYRTRYNTYQVDPALRWHTGASAFISAGPSFQYYRLDVDDNNGRFIRQPSRIGSYDSLTVDKDKAHVGLVINYNTNQRNNLILPSAGYYFNVTLQGYKGLNNYSRSFAQLRPEFTFYQKLDSKGTIVISDRVGGGITVGQAAFYQSMFLGGQGNLLGYLQNRFAGRHMAYNNLQARAKLIDVASYILPGQLGVTGFYDAGRVWVKNESSDKIHQGVGGGLYFAPAGMAVIQALAGHSSEGWYPYISLNVRL